MNRNEYLEELKNRLNGLPEEDVDEYLSFYSEIIDDRIEEGLSEEEAVAQTGGIDETVSGILGEYPLSGIMKARMKRGRRLKPLEILLIILGAPLGLPLLCVAFSMILAFFAVIFSIVLSLWVIDAAVAASALGGIASAVLFIVKGDVIQGIFMAGASLACAGLSILMFFVCKGVSRVTLILLKKFGLRVKTFFVGKEKKQ